VYVEVGSARGGVLEIRVWKARNGVFSQETRRDGAPSLISTSVHEATCRMAVPRIAREGCWD
jgi:hypothetical protein